jgi:hypothetical protein
VSADLAVGPVTTSAAWELTGANLAVVSVPSTIEASFIETLVDLVLEQCEWTVARDDSYGVYKRSAREARNT